MVAISTVAGLANEYLASMGASIHARQLDSHSVTRGGDANVNGSENSIGETSLFLDAE